jgi:hypothetical protein
MWRHVDLVWTDVSEECVASIFRAEKSASEEPLFGITLLKHGRHFDYWNQTMNMRMRVCYLECHEAGLCCYLVIHIENLLHPLKLFYFHLGPIYWLSIAYRSILVTTFWRIHPLQQNCYFMYTCFNIKKTLHFAHKLYFCVILTISSVHEPVELCKEDTVYYPCVRNRIFKCRLN